MTRRVRPAVVSGHLIGLNRKEVTHDETGNWFCRDECSIVRPDCADGRHGSEED
jgi:hypothetical protein